MEQQQVVQPGFAGCPWADESGVTAIEYGLLAALIGLVCVASFATVGGSLAAAYAQWTAAVAAAL